MGRSSLPTLAGLSPGDRPAGKEIKEAERRKNTRAGGDGVRGSRRGKRIKKRRKKKKTEMKEEE